MNVGAAIHMHARLRPRAPAVITPRRALNFAQLDAAIWRAAVHFRAQGLEALQVVALDIRDSVRHLVVALALKSEVHHQVPVAAVTLRAPVAEADLLAYCRSRLGLRAPRRVVSVEAFPRNPAGKILKRELARQLSLAGSSGETKEKTDAENPGGGR